METAIGLEEAAGFCVSVLNMYRVTKYTGPAIKDVHLIFSDQPANTVSLHTPLMTFPIQNLEYITN